MISTTTSGSSSATTTGLPPRSVGTSLALEPPREYTQPTVQEIPGASMQASPPRWWALLCVLRAGVCNALEGLWRASMTAWWVPKRPSRFEIW